MFDYLEELCAFPGISGRETPVADYIAARLPEDCTVRRDALGNLLVHKTGENRPRRRLMLCAHMDEVGMMVNHITPDGLLGFVCVGGIDPRVLIARTVLVGEKAVPGVIGIKPIHLTKQDDCLNIPGADELSIDIGARDQAEAQEWIQLGDYVTFRPGMRRLGGQVLESKAIDDRLGCAVLLKLLQQKLPYDLDAAFTVQEEVGARGARAASYTLAPEIALILETTTAADVIGVKAPDRVCEQGKGAVVPFMDRGTIYDKGLYDLAFHLAGKNGIPIQTKTRVAGGNDAGTIQHTREGVRCLAISAPCRYLHSPGVTVRESDIQAAADLTEKLAVEICRREET